MAWPGSMACSPGSYRLHVRPKMDSERRMFAIVVHLAMFATVKHFPLTVHFEAGHCKRYEPGEQAIDPGQAKLQDRWRWGFYNPKTGCWREL